MKKSELFRQAMGLKRTATKALNTGHGNMPAESVVRSAAQNLIWSAIRCDSNDSGMASLKTNPGMTWSEVHAVASAVGEFAKEGKPEPEHSV
jgi:hypothetical protein